MINKIGQASVAELMIHNMMPYCDLLILTFTLIVGGVMAWAIGANDVANAMASTVGSKVLTVRQAILIAAVFEAAGAMLASGQVTNMIRHGIVDLSFFQTQPELFICGMLAALMASATWLMVATSLGLPVSTTHSIIGAIIGFACVSVGWENIYWYNILAIATSWILTPCCSMLVSALLFSFIQTSIFSTRRSYWACLIQIPCYSALVCGVFAYVILFYGLEPLGFAWGAREKYLLLSGFGGVAFLIGLYQVAYKGHLDQIDDQEDFYEAIEKVFGDLAIITSCSMAFSHGANDVANAIGPIAAIASTVSTGTVVESQGVIPLWMVAYGAAAIVLGLVMYGYKIMETVGDNITQLTPLRGFCAQFSTSVIIIVASGFGMPVSTTQTMVGSVLGMGLVRGMQAINTTVVVNIFLSWAVTLPMGAFLAMLYYEIFVTGVSAFGHICYW